MCLYGSVNRTVCFFLLLEAQETHSQNEIIPPSFSHDSAAFHDAIIQLLSANLIIFQGDFYRLTLPIPHPSSLFTSVDERMANHECRLCQPVKRADLRHYMICIMYSFLTLYSYIYNKVSCTLFRRKAVRGSRYGDDMMLVDASPPVLSQEKGAFCNYFHGVCEISLHFFRCNR